MTITARPRPAHLGRFCQSLVRPRQSPDCPRVVLARRRAMLTRRCAMLTRRRVHTICRQMRRLVCWDQLGMQAKLRFVDDYYRPSPSIAGPSGPSLSIVPVKLREVIRCEGYTWLQTVGVSSWTGK